MSYCYECDLHVPSLEELSGRSRCVHCEHRRAVFNETENDLLRANYGELEAKYLALLATTVGARKACPGCASTELIELSSLDQKICNNCKAVHSWKLDEGQTPKY